MSWWSCPGDATSKATDRESDQAKRVADVAKKKEQETKEEGVGGDFKLIARTS